MGVGIKKRAKIFPLSVRNIEVSAQKVSTILTFQLLQIKQCHRSNIVR